MPLGSDLLLIIGETEQFAMCSLAVLIPSCVKCLFMSFPYFLFGRLFLI